MSRKPDPSLIRPVKEYTIGWICALPLEQQASGSVFDNIHSTTGHPDIPDEGQSGDVYILGNIGNLNIVLATLTIGRYGNVRAAVVATQLVSSFRSIKFLLMVGIAGGIPNLNHKGADIRLGDVVVSVPEGEYNGVVKWDMGKTEKGNKFKRTGSLNQPPAKLLSAVGSLRFNHTLYESEISSYITEVQRKYPNLPGTTYLGSENDVLFQADYEHEDQKNQTCHACDPSRTVHRESRKSKDPVIHYGIIASGDQVIKHAPTRDELRSQLNAKCVEMEGAGTMDAFPCLVVRGICDYSDSHKNKDWQPYAALTAAAYTKELLMLLQTQNVTSPQPTAAQEPQGALGPPRLEASRSVSQYYYRPVEDRGSNGVVRSRPQTERVPHDVNIMGRASGSNEIRIPGAQSIQTPLLPSTPLPHKLRKYSIAAVNWDNWHYRLYFQTSQGIFEGRRDEDEWQITKIPGIDAAIYTPLAAVARRKGQDIRLYYLSPDFVIQEHRYTEAKGWLPGTLESLEVSATPSSRLAAVEWSGNIRVYFQGSNYDKIEELRYMDNVRSRGSGNVKGWERGATLCSALNGTSLAAATYIADRVKIHIFYQDGSYNVRELVYKGDGFEEGTESNYI
ncbi:hypothetical protein TWF730_006075 [Orbilia blumenaviensis]|uniref:Nucleoside phosphorylase domain-containing protein n=1 Tax=Orbilia blumenaviensis TaxID=1796055 RepID=A0AAV9TY78_9PEZI